MMQGSSSGSSRSKPKLQPKAYAYAEIDAIPPERFSGCIPVMVGITATVDKRVPVDLIVILHLRFGHDCSVPKNWLQLLKKAMAAIRNKLDDNDKLAVLPRLPTLRRPADVPQLPTSNESLLEALESADSILHDRKLGDKESRAGHIIVISNSNEGTGSLLAWKLRKVHAFGFRDAHNARTMHSISKNRGCFYGVLDDGHGEITRAFLACIDSITSAVPPVPIEVKLKCDQRVLLSAIDTPGTNYSISYDKKAAIVWPSVHLFDVPTNFIVYLSHLLPHDDFTKLFTIHVKYGNVSEKFDFSRETEKPDLKVVTRGMDGSKEVAAEIARSEAFKIVADIVTEDKNDWEQLYASADYLRKRWTELKDSDCGKVAGEEGQIPRLAGEMQEMETRLYNNYFWLEYMLSWLSHQRCQLPLPRPFMYNQSMDDPITPLKIFAKVNVVPGKITGHPGRLPMLVQLMATEAGLAKVKRASVDLIAVLDVSYGAKEMKQKTKRSLLIWAKEKAEEYNKAEEMLAELQEKQKLLDMTMEENNKEKQEMQIQITQRRLEMETIAEEMAALNSQAEEPEKGLKEVMDKTHGRLKLLIKAMDLVMNKLSDNDRLAIIPVYGPATGLLKMSKQGRSEASARVKSLVDLMVRKRTMAYMVRKRTMAPADTEAAQTSRRGRQLKKVMKLVRNCFPSATDSSIPSRKPAERQGTAPMSTYSADVGDCTTLEKALTDAAKMLDDRRGQEKDRMGFIIVISDSDDDSICSKTLFPNYIIHAFGFCDTHNTRALYHIARCSNGIYDILDRDGDQITAPFMACINEITSIIAVDIKVDIECSHTSSAVLSKIDTGRYINSIENRGTWSSISVHALNADAARDFIIYMDNVPKEDYDRLSELLTVRVKWLHALSRTEEKVDCQVVVVRSEDEDNIDIYKEVAKDCALGEAVKIARVITDPNYNNGIAPDELHKMRGECLNYALIAGEDLLENEMIKMGRILRNVVINDNRNFKNMLANKLSYMFSWLSYMG